MTTKERQTDIQPHEPESPVSFSVPEIQPADHRAQQDKGNIPDNSPGHIRAVLHPAVLRKEAQDDPAGSQYPDAGRQAPRPALPVVPGPYVIQHDIKHGHGNGGNQFPDSQGGGEICGHKIIQDPGNQVEGVSAAENQCSSAHKLFRHVQRLFQDQTSGNDGKKQIQNIKCGFTVFHVLFPFLHLRPAWSGSAAVLFPYPDSGLFSFLSFIYM